MLTILFNSYKLPHIYSEARRKPTMQILIHTKLFSEQLKLDTLWKFLFLSVKCPLDDLRLK